MAVVIALVTSGIANARPRLKRFFKKVSDGLDALAETHVRNAVSERALRRARNDMRRFDRLIHTPVACQRNRTAPRPRRSKAR